MKRYCPSCRVDKDSSEFNKNVSNSSGLQTACRICQNTYKTEMRIQVIHLISPLGTCQWPGCTVDDPDMLDIDHIEDGSGSVERGPGNPGAGQTRMIRNIVSGKRTVQGLQVLCANHHAKKTRSWHQRDIRGNGRVG